LFRVKHVYSWFYLELTHFNVAIVATFQSLLRIVLSFSNHLFYLSCLLDPTKKMEAQWWQACIIPIIQPLSSNIFNYHLRSIERNNNYLVITYHLIIY
ncbi:hypothetical protein ACJX0J_027386, partial [Zea mays]